MDRTGLINRLGGEEDFRNSLTGRMVSLFGQRNELIPFIPPELVNLIDTKLTPMFIIRNGTYTFKQGMVQEFAEFIDEARLLVVSIETKLIEEHKKQLK
jgi:hypothetical protein